MRNGLPPGALLKCVGNQPTAQEWLCILANLGRAERTIDAYGRGLDQYLGFCTMQGIEPIRATLTDVSLFVRWQRGEDDAKRAPVANSTLLQRITAIRLWYDHLVYSGLRERNPVPRSAHLRGMTSDQTRPGVGRALVRKVDLLPKIPDQEGWMRVVAEAAREDIRNRLMFALAYFGALRREELVSLRVPDIDAAHRLVTVRAETSKTASNRVVSYPACAGRSLMEYLLQRHALDATPGPGRHSVGRAGPLRPRRNRSLRPHRRPVPRRTPRREPRNGQTGHGLGIPPVFRAICTRRESGEEGAHWYLEISVKTRLAIPKQNPEIVR